MRCKCPQCKKVYEIADELAGKKLRCGDCKTAFTTAKISPPGSAPTGVLFEPPAAPPPESPPPAAPRLSLRGTPPAPPAPPSPPRPAAKPSVPAAEPPPAPPSKPSVSVAEPPPRPVAKLAVLPVAEPPSVPPSKPNTPAPEPPPLPTVKPALPPPEPPSPPTPIPPSRDPVAPPPVPPEPLPAAVELPKPSLRLGGLWHKLSWIAAVLALLGGGAWAVFHFAGSRKAAPPGPETAEAKPNPVVPEKVKPTGPPAERAENYEAALARAKETGKDIVVLQRGSDWNRLGEELYNKIWNTEDFARELGDAFVLVDVDHPEAVGGTVLKGLYASEADVPEGLSPAARLSQLADEKSPLPACDVVAVDSDGKVPYVRRPDGAYVVDGVSGGPGQDLLTLKMKTAGGGRFLLLDFPTDPALPANGPGLAGNGNSIIGEIEIEFEGARIKAEVLASVSQSNGGRVAATAFDGVKVQGDKGWDGEASGWELGAGKGASLMLGLSRELPAGAEFAVRLVAKSKWGGHVPGSFRAVVLRSQADFQNAIATQPASDIVAVESEQKTPFRQRQDGTFVARLVPNPGQDVLSLKLKSERGGSLLRLDFPTDPILPGAGPGRAGNGNFALSEVEVLEGTKPVKAEAAWASYSEGGWGPWLAVDGIADKTESVWNPGAHQHRQRTLLVALSEPVPAGNEVTVRLVCRSQWGQHVPGCLRAAMLADPEVDRDLRLVMAAQLKNAKDAKFSWRDNTYCPRIALLDCQGRAVACDNKPRSSLSYETMAAEIRQMREIRVKRDQLWKSAETAAGPAKADLLRQSLDLLGFANWAGNENGYKFVHDEIRKADPKDESGAVRWLGFGGDPRTGCGNILDAVWKARDAKDYEGALALVDQAVKDPRNKILTHEQVQRIMKAKFDLCRSWPGHEEQRFEVQREIAAYDPDTYWGVGAIGYMACQGRYPEHPMLTYGWKSHHVQAGPAQSWKMPDTVNYFDHAGPYQVRLNFSGGKDVLQVQRIALFEGGAVLAEARPAADLGPGKNVEATLDLKSWNPEAKHQLQVDYAAAEGKTDSNGSFSIDPLLPDLAGGAPAPATPPDIAAWQKLLGDTLMAEALQGPSGRQRILDDAGLRQKLAQYEVIRSCGADKVAAVAAQPGGAEFLKAFWGDQEWMEAFLSSWPADFGQSLENLRLICQRCQGWQTPLYKRLATACALSWGNGNRWRLVTRFDEIRRAHQGGLMHACFDRYTVREMCWSIDLAGSSREYQAMLDDRQQTLGEYFGACWAVWYRDPNDYGDSVQGWLYITPWVHAYGNGLGDRPFIAHKAVGGVCGTLSGFGSRVARAHGIMSTTVGQPGHCAYIIRVGDEWPVGYSVTWPTGAGVPGWDGVGYSTLHRLYEPVQADRKSYLEAARWTWVGRLMVDRSVNQARTLPGLRYKQYSLPNGALPDFSKLTPAKEGEAMGITLGSAMPANPNNFGIVWEGKFEASGKGPLVLSLQSDDASRLLVDGEVLLTANCNRVEKELSLSGTHALRVEYSQGGGGYNLAVGMNGVCLPGTWQQAYEQAIAAQPTNYGSWLEYVKALEKTRDVPDATWLDLGRRAAKTLSVCNEAGWAMTQRCLDKVLPKMKPEERLAVLLDCHRELRQENWRKPEAYQIEGNFNWQADRLGDPALAVAFFGQLLAIHHSDKPENNWIFGSVMGWGASRFAANPATATAYAKAMADYFKSQGDGVDKGQMANTIAAGIRKSSETGNLQSYRQWSEMAATLLPPLQPGDVHLNPAQAQACPKVGAPSGSVLLSADGMLQTSSACQFDRPLSYRAILGTGSFGGWFDTNNEEKPWAQVQLAGDSLITGIVLVDRYEYTDPNNKGQVEELAWAVPLQVSVSADGKAWTQVETIDQPSPDKIYKIKLAGKNIQARYVRIERQPNPDKTKPPGRLHFRSFLVYGKKLY